MIKLRVGISMLVMLLAAALGLPGIAGAVEMMPTPTITTPKPAERFTMTPGLSVAIEAVVPEAFVAKAAATPETERWHVLIYKKSANGSYGSPISDYYGDITASHFGGVLDNKWFRAHHGAGSYKLYVYLVRVAADGKQVVAPGVARTFEVLVPGFHPIKPKPGGLVNAPMPTMIKMPDITSSGGMKINGKHVPWGGTLDISETDATKAAGGTCTYSDIYYDVENAGSAAAGPFTNRWYSGYQAHVEVGTQSDLMLQPGEMQRLRTQELHMVPGANPVVLVLDADNEVNESNENNNRLSVTVNVHGKCRNLGILRELLSH